MNGDPITYLIAEQVGYLERIAQALERTDNHLGRIAKAIEPATTKQDGDEQHSTNDVLRMIHKQLEQMYVNP